MHVFREGFGDEGGLASASRRFLFTYDGQEYVWAKHRKFAGDNLSCENLSTGNVVAYYTNKMLPKKLQGILVIEPQASIQVMPVKSLVCFQISKLLVTLVVIFLHCHFSMSFKAHSNDMQQRAAINAAACG